jgi:hypothetical protein
MTIQLKGRDLVTIHESNWDACQEIAGEFGWMPEIKKKACEHPFLNDYEADAVPEHNARALARALYRAIHAIETDSLSEPLIYLVKTASVRNLRAVADLAYAGGFYID